MPLKSSASWVNKEISLSIRGDTTVSAIWPLSLLQGNVYHKNSASCFSSFLMSVLEVELTRVSDESVGLELELEKNYGLCFLEIPDGFDGLVREKVEVEKMKCVRLCF
jgi:hypothetical protein